MAPMICSHQSEPQRITDSDAPRIRKGQPSIFVSQEYAKTDVEAIRRMQGYVEDGGNAQNMKLFCTLFQLSMFDSCSAV